MHMVSLVGEQTEINRSATEHTTYTKQANTSRFENWKTVYATDKLVWSVVTKVLQQTAEKGILFVAVVVMHF